MARWTLLLCALAALGVVWLLRDRRADDRTTARPAATASRAEAPTQALPLPAPTPSVPETPAEGQTTTAGDEVVPPPANHPGIALFGPSGKPVDGAKVTLAVSRDRFRTLEVVQASTDASGRVTATWPSDAWVVIDVRAKGLTPQVVSITTADADPLGLHLAEGRSFRGTLHDLKGRPVAGERLRLVPIVVQTSLTDRVLSGLPLVDAEATTDAEGVFEASSLRPGAYRVVFVDQPKLPAAVLRAADVEAGAATVRIPR